MTYRPYNEIINALNLSKITFSLLNLTGAPIAAFTPLTTDALGNLKLVDVSVEADILNVVGISIASILNNTNGTIVNQGKIENVNLFNLKDSVWISKTGTLINTAPEVGVNGFQAGDFIVKIGSIIKNQQNPLNKDLLVNIQVIGQLV